MALDTEEAVRAAFSELPVIQNIVEKVKALPPKETRKLVDYGPILGLDPAGNLYSQLAIIDQLEEDIKD